MENKELVSFIKGTRLLMEKIDKSFSKIIDSIDGESLDYKLRRLMCDEDNRFSHCKFRRNKCDIYEHIEDAIEERLMSALEDKIGALVELIETPQGDRPMSELPEKELGKNYYVIRLTEAENYEYFRLDRDKFDMYPAAYSGSGIIDIKRFASGIESFEDVIDLLLEGMIMRVGARITDFLSEMGSGERMGKFSEPTFKLDSFCDWVEREKTEDSVLFCTSNLYFELKQTLFFKPQGDDLSSKVRGQVGTFLNVPVMILPETSFSSNHERPLNIAYIASTKGRKNFRVLLEGRPYLCDHYDDNILNIYQKMAFAYVYDCEHYNVYECLEIK